MDQVGGGGLREKYVFCVPRAISAAPISLLSMGGVCGRSLTARKILFTGRQTWSLYLVLWLCGWYQHVIEMLFWLYICSHSVSRIRTEGKNFWIYLLLQIFYQKKKDQSRIINFIDHLNLVYASTIHREKKLSHFDPKSWVTGGTEIRSGKMGNWRIFESIRLSMLSQFDSQCWVNLTLNVESIWLSMLSQFDSQCWVNLTLNVESVWLSMLSQFDSQCWTNLTLNVESIWLSMLSQFECWANLTVNFESIWLSMLNQILLSMLSQFDCQCWVNLTQIFSSYPLCRV